MKTPEESSQPPEEKSPKALAKPTPLPPVPQSPVLISDSDVTPPVTPGPAVPKVAKPGAARYVETASGRRIKKTAAKHMRSAECRAAA